MTIQVSHNNRFHYQKEELLQHSGITIGSIQVDEEKFPTDSSILINT